MKSIRSLLESAGYEKVETYLNSGNIIFVSDRNREQIAQDVYKIVKDAFGLEIPILIKTAQELKQIADAIPREWKNDSTQRSDVAYLFPEIDGADIIDELPVNRACMDINYIEGALIWNMDRKNNSRSRLSKLAGHKIYQLMTIRNVNTARYLGSL